MMELNCELEVEDFEDDRCPKQEVKMEEDPSGGIADLEEDTGSRQGIKMEEDTSSSSRQEIMKLEEDICSRWEIKVEEEAVGISDGVTSTPVVDVKMEHPDHPHVHSTAAAEISITLKEEEEEEMEEQEEGDEEEEQEEEEEEEDEEGMWPAEDPTLTSDSQSMKQPNDTRKTSAKRKKGKRHQCIKCGMTFKLNNLRQHQKTCAGKKFQCDLCEKAFGTKSTLAKHQRFHTTAAAAAAKRLCQCTAAPAAETPYQCTACGKFLGKESVNRDDATTDQQVSSCACSRNIGDASHWLARTANFRPIKPKVVVPQSVVAQTQNLTLVSPHNGAGAQSGSQTQNLTLISPPDGVSLHTQSGSQVLIIVPRKDTAFPVVAAAATDDNGPPGRLVAEGTPRRAVAEGNSRLVAKAPGRRLVAEVPAGRSVAEVPGGGHSSRPVHMAVGDGAEKDVDFFVKFNFLDLPFEQQLRVLERGRPTPDVSITQTKSSRVRTFNRQHFTKTEWLTASPTTSKLFCWPCLLFDKTAGHPWVCGGYADMLNLSRGIERHEKSKPHIVATMKMKVFGKERVEVDREAEQRRSKQHNAQVSKNREVLKRLVSIVIFLAKQGLPFHGHRDDYSDSDEEDDDDDDDVRSRDRRERSLIRKRMSNRGNYTETVHFLAEMDEVLAAHLAASSPWETEFVGESSAAVQRELVRSVATVIQREVDADVGAAPFIAVQVDDLFDITEVKGQLSVIIRYVDQKGAVCERFLSLTDIVGVDEKCRAWEDAQAVSTAILAAVESYEPAAKLVCLSHDGTSCLTSGLTSCLTSGLHGKAVDKRAVHVQSLVKERCPHVQVVPCYAHELTQVLSEALSGLLRPVGFFFGQLGGFLRFFSVSSHRAALLREVDPSLVDIEESDGETYGGPRFTVRIGDFKRRAVHVVSTGRDSLLEVFERVLEEPRWDMDSTWRSSMLLDHLDEFNFLFLLQTFRKVFDVMAPLVEELRRSEADQQGWTPPGQVEAVCKDLVSTLRTPEGFLAVFSHTEEMVGSPNDADIHGIRSKGEGSNQDGNKTVEASQVQGSTSKSTEAASSNQDTSKSTEAASSSQDTSKSTEAASSSQDTSKSTEAAGYSQDTSKSTEAAVSNQGQDSRSNTAGAGPAQGSSSTAAAESSQDTSKPAEDSPVQGSCSNTTEAAGSIQGRDSNSKAAGAGPAQVQVRGSSTAAAESSQDTSQTTEDSPVQGSCSNTTEAAGYSQDTSKPAEAAGSSHDRSKIAESQGSSVKATEGQDSSIKIESQGCSINIESQGSSIKMESRGCSIKIESQGCSIKATDSHGSSIKMEGQGSSIKATDSHCSSIKMEGQGSSIKTTDSQGSSSSLKRDWQGNSKSNEAAVDRYQHLFFQVIDGTAALLRERFADAQNLLFFPLLDHTRFPDYNGRAGFPDFELKQLLDVYPSLFDQSRLRNELLALYDNAAYHKRPEDLLRLLVDDQLLTTLPEVTRLCQLILTFPVRVPSTPSASPSPSPSRLERLESYLRSTTSSSSHPGDLEEEDSCWYGDLCKIAMETAVIELLEMKNQLFDRVTDHFASITTSSMPLSYE